MRRLPHSDLLVSELALGTMTFGDQVSQEQAMTLLDQATGDYGINFIVRESDLLIFADGCLGHRRDLPRALCPQYIWRERTDHRALAGAKEGAAEGCGAFGSR